MLFQGNSGKGEKKWKKKKKAGTVANERVTEHLQARKIQQVSVISFVFSSFTEMSHFKPILIDSMAFQKRG